MTTATQPPSDLDGVLTAFQRAHPRPSTADVAEWCARHPTFAEELRNHAAALLLSSLDPGKGNPVRYQATLDRAIQRARERVAADRAGEPPRGGPGERSFAELLASRGLDVPALARSLDVARVVIGEYVSGRMALPARRSFPMALADRLRVTGDVLASSVATSRATAEAGQARAEGAPAPTSRTYDEVVEQSPMSDERKAYWLERD
jgi:hypothetical protein